MVDLKEIEIELDGKKKKFQAYEYGGNYAIVLKGERHYFNKDGIEITNEEKPKEVTGGFKLDGQLFDKIKGSLAHKTVTLDDLTTEKQPETKHDLTYLGYELKSGVLYTKVRNEATEEEFLCAESTLGQIVTDANKQVPVEKITQEQTNILKQYCNKSTVDAYSKKE